MTRPHRSPTTLRTLFVALALAAGGLAALAAVHRAEACGPAKHAPHGIYGYSAESLPTRSIESPAVADVPCVDGWAGIYACQRIDLVAVLPRSAMGADPQFVETTDLWGWVDPQTGIEYALVGLFDGTAFVSLENPSSPRFLGKLPTRTVTAPWRDIKVYRDHAFIVADGLAHGLQVFDLTQLRGVGSPRTFQPTAEYVGPGLTVNGGFSLGNAHNIALNEETGFAYAVGSSTCGAGLHMIDVREPRRPRFAGCFGDTGYTHDTQCVIYRGPDPDYQGRELCFNSDPQPSSLSVVDVTDKQSPRLIANVPYPGGAYSHQGWLTVDQRYFLLGDELDEVTFGHPTRTLIWDVSDLDAPRLLGQNDTTTLSIGHNMYTEGGLVYQANYTSGVRIYRLDRLAQAELPEVAYFDLFPATDGPQFSGAWTVYPYLPSGLLIASSMEGGLFVLRPDLSAGAGIVPGSGPPRPTRLRIALDDFDAMVSWTDRATNEEGFRVYRSVNRGPALLYAEVPPDATAFADVVEPGTVIEYRITAFNEAGESEESRVSVWVPEPELEIRPPRPELLEEGGPLGVGGD